MLQSILARLRSFGPVARPYRALRGAFRRVVRALDKRTLSEERFVECLRETGIAEGRTVMVHCSMDHVSPRVPSMNPVRIIQTLQRLLGPEGTLLMPTSPFSGRESSYVETHYTFDVRRTPSKTGLLTEVFRRMPGVCRSLHPTHSVAGWGKHARELLVDRPLTTAFGTDSPFYRMRLYDGLVVGLGVGLRQAFTIVHVIEELHPRTREIFFEKTPYQMTIIDGERTTSYSSHALKGGVWRNPADLEKALLKDGTLRYVTRRGLLFSVAEAGAFIDRGLELVESRVYIPE